MTDPMRDLSEINVTPLVDVMLVLLVIFIETVPVMRLSIPVNLPQSQAQALKETPHRSDIVMKEDGSYYLEGKAVTQEALTATLTQAAVNPQAFAEINADQACRYGDVISLLNLVKHAGITKVGFATQR